MKRGELLRWFVLAFALLGVSVTTGLLVSSSILNSMLQGLKEFLGPLRDVGHLSLLLIIFFNNSIKSLSVIVLGALFGLPPLAYVVVNGFVIGVVAGAVAATKGPLFTLASLAPHGVIEIAMLLLSASIGFSAGWEALKWLARKPSSTKQKIRAGLKLYVRWVLPGLAVAALIEVFVTGRFVKLVSG